MGLLPELDLRLLLFMLSSISGKLSHTLSLQKGDETRGLFGRRVSDRSIKPIGTECTAGCKNHWLIVSLYMYQGGHMKKIIFALVAAVLAVFLLSSCKSPEERAQHYYEQGRFAGDSDRAIEYFTRSLRLNPDRTNTRRHRALTHARRGEIDLALADFDEIFRITPGHLFALRDRAELFEQLGYLELAFADLTELIGIYATSREPPSDHRFQAYRNRANFSLRHGEYERAIADFITMAQLAADNPTDSPRMQERLDIQYMRAHFDRAQVHIELGEYERAVEIFTGMAQAASLEPTGFQYLRAHFHRAQAHLALGEYQRAIADFTVAAHYPSRFLSASYFWRATAHMEMGAFALAIADFDEALEHRPRDARVVRQHRVQYEGLLFEHEFAEAHTQRGVAHLELGDLEQAIADFTQAISLTPRRPGMSIEEMRRRNWGSSFQQQQVMLARIRYQSLARVTPTGMRHQRAAIAMVNLINTPARQRARENISMAAAAAADAAWVRDMSFRRRRNENGVTLWPPADFAAAHTLRALAYLERGDYGLAIADFEDALRIAPDNFAAWEELEAALNVEPEHPFASEILSMVMEQATASP